MHLCWGREGTVHNHNIQNILSSLTRWLWSIKSGTCAIHMHIAHNLQLVWFRGDGNIRHALWSGTKGTNVCAFCFLCNPCKHRAVHTRNFLVYVSNMLVTYYMQHQIT